MSCHGDCVCSCCVCVLVVCLRCLTVAVFIFPLLVFDCSFSSHIIGSVSFHLVCCPFTRLKVWLVTGTCMVSHHSRASLPFLRFKTEQSQSSSTNHRLLVSHSRAASWQNLKDLFVINNSVIFISLTNRQKFDRRQYIYQSHAASQGIFLQSRPRFGIYFSLIFFSFSLSFHFRYILREKGPGISEDRRLPTTLLATFPATPPRDQLRLVDCGYRLLERRPRSGNRV